MPPSLRVVQRLPSSTPADLERQRLGAGVGQPLTVGAGPNSTDSSKPTAELYRYPCQWRWLVIPAKQAVWNSTGDQAGNLRPMALLPPETPSRRPARSSTVGKCRAITTACRLTARVKFSSRASSIKKPPAHNSARVLSTGMVMRSRSRAGAGSVFHGDLTDREFHTSIEASPMGHLANEVGIGLAGPPQGRLSGLCSGKDERPRRASGRNVCTTAANAGSSGILLLCRPLPAAERNRCGAASRVEIQVPFDSIHSLGQSVNGCSKLYPLVVEF